MSNDKANIDDVEAAVPLLYPSQQENPQLRWAFIRKVYAILAVQLLATIAVAAFVAGHRSIALFFGATWVGVVVYIVILIVLIIVIGLLDTFHQEHPINFLLLGIFTVLVGLCVGLIASFVSPLIVIEATIATLVIVVSLSVYTFWASMRGEDFKFFVALVLTIAITLILLVIFQIFFPPEKFTHMLFNGPTMNTFGLRF